MIFLPVFLHSNTHCKFFQQVTKRRVQKNPDFRESFPHLRKDKLLPAQDSTSQKKISSGTSLRSLYPIQRIRNAQGWEPITSAGMEERPMMKFQKRELVAGLILLCTATGESVAREVWLQDSEDMTFEDQGKGSEWDGPNILDIMIQDGEGVTPPTPVNGGYLTGMVLQQYIRANWLQSEIGLQLFHEGEKLDPRRYEVEWKILTSSSPVVKAHFVDSHDLDFGQRIQIETPLTMMHARVLGTIEVEARIIDREEPEKAPVIVVQSLRELLSNGRDGL
jgi:hypothetical protein